ncbi:MAG TPA: hypothetical protein VE199_02530 [Nitrososphaera sp.]|nr:hypothetical protein [Nitrososphaera sp.]
MQREKISTYHVIMDHDDNLELKSEFLVRLYTAMDSKAREIAPENIRKELAITQDGRIKTKFYIRVSNRMAPHFINAIQQQINIEEGICLRLYLCKLQEQLMSQLFGRQDETSINNIQFDTKSFFPPP